MAIKDVGLNQSTLSLGMAIASWLTRKRVRVYTTAVTVLTALAWIINWLIRPAITGTSRYLIIGGDFLSVYAAGRYLLEGRLNDLYNFPAQLAFLQRILAPAVVNALPLFILPPYYAVVSAPFAVGPYPLALVLWLIAGLLALAAAVFMFRRAVLPRREHSTGRLLLQCLVFCPTLECFLYGQNSAFSLLLYTMIFVLLRGQVDFAAGLALGGLLYKPQLGIGFGLVLLVQRRWKTLAGALVSAAAWLLIGFVLSPQAMLQYGGISTHLVDVQQSGMWGEHSFVFFVLLLLNGIWPNAAGMVAILSMAVGLVIVGRWWWGQPWQPGTRAWDFRMAASIAMGLLISPHLYWYDLMLLLLPLGIVWHCYLTLGGGRLLDGGLVLAWTGLLYVASWLSSYVTLAQLKLTAALGLPATALQVSVPIIVAWSIVVYRQAQMAEQAPSAATMKSAAAEVAAAI